MMFKPRFRITNKINNALLEVERARGFLDAARLKADWVSEMQSDALILEAHHSTHIEGTELTLSQARGILTGKRVGGVRPDDRQELLNYRDALDFVSGYLDKKSEVTEDLIREIHRILVKDVRGGSLEPGRYRVVQNYVVNSLTGEVIYTPPPPEKVPGLMREFVDWLNDVGDVSPVLVAGVAQHGFVDIHPFLDGNGRTARLLCTLILYQNGYDFKRLFSLSEFYDMDRGAYYEAIQGVRDHDMDLTGWLEYFVDGLKSQMIGVRARGEEAIKKDVVLEKARKLDLNERQVRAVKYVAEMGKINISGFKSLAQMVSDKTLYRDLQDLVEKEILKGIGEKKGRFYVLR